jgi:hypothetical protein
LFNEVATKRWGYTGSVPVARILADVLSPQTDVLVAASYQAELGGAERIAKREEWVTSDSYELSLEPKVARV